MARLVTHRHGGRFTRKVLGENTLTLSRSGPVIGLRITTDEDETATRAYTLEISLEELQKIVDFRDSTMKDFA